MPLVLEVLPLEEAGSVTSTVSMTCPNTTTLTTLAQHFVVARQLTRSVTGRYSAARCTLPVLLDQLLFSQPFKKAHRTLWDPHVHYRLHNSSTTRPSAEPHQSNPIHALHFFP